MLSRVKELQDGRLEIVECPVIVEYPLTEEYPAKRPLEVIDVDKEDNPAKKKPRIQKSLHYAIAVWI